MLTGLFGQEDVLDVHKTYSVIVLHHNLQANRRSSLNKLCSPFRIKS